MPGSIQVSVLDFKKLPSSSNSVKISLGKVEYEAREKEMFCFPLTNLRDNLIITIHDSEGNQVSHSGVGTLLILEKGVWDDVFSVEGGGLIHMKLEFILGDEERDRIRSMRESATKKKQAEILGSRLTNAENAKFLASALKTHEVSDKKEETPSSHMTEEIQKNPNGSSNLVEKSYVQNLEDNKISSDVKKTNKERRSYKNNEFLLQQAEATKKLLDDTKTYILENNNAAKPIPLGNLVEKLDQQSLEDKNPNLLKKMSKERKFQPFSHEKNVNAIKTNDIQLQETSLPKTLKGSSSSDVGSSRLTVAEKIKSFSPKLPGEMDKKASLEKTPQNIKKMISVFESGLSKDRVPLKPSTKSNRFGTSRLWKDDTVEKPELHLKNSEVSSSTRLRSSFSTGDLAKNLSSIITKDDQVEVDDDFVESAEIVEKVNNLISVGKMGRLGDGSKQTGFPSQMGEEIGSSESADGETSTGPFGQAIKIALVIGFGVVVLLFRQRETGKGKKESSRASRNIVLMNKRGSIEEQRRRIRVSWSS